jgi:hypothetical protein
VHPKPPTGTHPKPPTASHAKPPTGTHPALGAGQGTASTRRVLPGSTSYRTNPGSKRGKITFGIIILVLVIAALSWGPFWRGLAMNKLDSFKGDPARIEEAKVAADAFLNLVDRNAGRVNYAITTNRGPVEIQVYMAKECKQLFPLVQIAERPLSDPPPPAPGAEAVPAEAPPAANTATVTQDQRIQALTTATEIYDKEAHKNERLPDDLPKWACDNQVKRELSIAAIQLMAKANRSYVSEAFLTIATTPGLDPLRVQAAIDAIGQTANSTNLVYAINLLNSRVCEQAMKSTSLIDTITREANGNHIESLIKLLSNPQPEVRAIAIEAMSNPKMNLSDSPENFRKRQEMGKLITPKLAPDAPTVELRAALKATKTLRLIGARDAVLALVPQYKSLKLGAEIDDKFFSELLGKSLIVTDMAPNTDATQKAESEKIEKEALLAGDDLVFKLTALLDDENCRAIAASALGLNLNPAFPNLRASLDRLANFADNPACLDALCVLVGKTYQRDDIVTTNGRDFNKWREFLAKDRPRFDRVRAIITYLEEKAATPFRVQDGRKRLGEAREFLNQAQEELDTWVNDAKYVPPIGVVKEKISILDRRVKELAQTVRTQWAGALNQD